MTALTFRTDCRHFRSDRPCAPHKQHGNVCATCDEYDGTATRVLLIKLGAMGDVLRTTCLLRGLIARYNAPLVWITRPESVDLLQHNPLVAETWATDDQLAGRLETEPFRAVINVDADRYSAAICAMARSASKLGFALDATGAVQPLTTAARSWWHTGLNDQLKRDNQQTYQQVVAAIAEIPPRDNELVFVLTDAERAAAREFAARALPAGTDALVGFNTGGADRWKRKQWTFAGFEQVARRILAETRHGIILYGGRGEVEFNGRLETALANPRVLNVNTQRSVREFGAMLSLCDVLVTGDTLGMHLGTALGKQIVAIFGPTSVAEIELYGRGTKIAPPVACRSFYRPVCEVTPCCVETIDPATVFAAVEQAVARR